MEAKAQREEEKRRKIFEKVGRLAGRRASFDKRLAPSTQNHRIKSYFWQLQKKGGKLHPNLVKPRHATESPGDQGSR
jgi:hypothetical protein